MRFFSWSCAVGFFALTTAVLINRSSRFRPVTWLGWILTTLGISLLVLLTKSSSDTTCAGLFIIAGVGLGISAPALVLAAVAPATNEELSTAVGLHSFSHCLGRAFGVAMGGTIFQNKLLLNFLKHQDLERPALTFTRDAIAFITSIQTMPGTPGSLKSVLVNAYVDSIRFAWIVLAALAGAATLLCLAGIRAVPALRNDTDDSTDFSHQMKTVDEER